MAATFIIAFMCRTTFRCMLLAAALAGTAPPVVREALSQQADRCRQVANAKDLGTGFDRFETTDGLNRTITFYLSANRMQDQPKPLVLFVCGSGCASLFSKTSDGRIAGGLPSLLLRASAGRVVVLAVEKPGVEFLAHPASPGSAEGCQECFLVEHTLDRWAEANDAALRAALTLPGIASQRVLVAGHSEGGIVAAAVAGKDRAVTHAAILAGGGPSQLFDMAEAARQPASPSEPLEQAEARVEEVYKIWTQVQADPMSVTKFAWGHPYRRWATFLASSPLDGLLASSAKVYLAYGTRDTNEPVASNDVLRAELTRRGRDVTCDRRIGEDHGFSNLAATEVAQHSAPRGPGNFQLVLENMLNWYLGSAAQRPGSAAPADTHTSEK